ncbi:MAG: hypothetical protein ACLQFR_28430 [Streptosporangiaceae bacterium]
MHKEQFGDRPVQAPLAAFLAPVAVVELRAPDLLVERIGITPLTGGLMESGVLDEVERKQRRAPCIERLEDDLSVVVGFERDRYDLEQIAQRDSQPLDPCGYRRVRAGSGIVGDLARRLP